jgi:hypothetical protein
MHSTFYLEVWLKVEHLPDKQWSPEFNPQFHKKEKKERKTDFSRQKKHQQALR